MKRIAIIKTKLYRQYNGTIIPVAYTFLCWDDDPLAATFIKDVEDEGDGYISVEIPTKKR